MEKLSEGIHWHRILEGPSLWYRPSFVLPYGKEERGGASVADPSKRIETRQRCRDQRAAQEASPVIDRY